MLDEKLIKLVSEHTFLYDKTTKMYKNINLKTKTWEEIGIKLNIPVKIARKRWSSLRDQYFREVRRNKSSSGSTAIEEKDKIKFKHYYRMNFLRDYYAPRLKQSSLPQTDEEIFIEKQDLSPEMESTVTYTSDLFDEDFCASTSVSGSISNKQKTKEDSKIDKFLDSITKTVEQADSLTHFFKFAEKLVREANLDFDRRMRLQNHLLQEITKELSK